MISERVSRDHLRIRLAGEDVLIASTGASNSLRRRSLVTPLTAEMNAQMKTLVLSWINAAGRLGLDVFEITVKRR
jgi:hypothetical protein